MTCDRRVTNVFFIVFFNLLLYFTPVYQTEYRIDRFNGATSHSVGCSLSRNSILPALAILTLQQH